MDPLDTGRLFAGKFHIFRSYSQNFFIKHNRLTNIIHTLVDLGTFPRKVMFLLAISLAMRILCLGAIASCLMLVSRHQNAILQIK